MPEDSKKTQDKKKNDPKDQRKPRNARNQANKVEKKAEKVEESKSAPKVPVPQKPPAQQDPGPEFYKNLKRETEEILKITEEENSKYKKKEIQSNWSKYEMPIESYDEIEENDVGADYEKLIQAPLSIGCHFQFKHEKSWDVNTGPSLYDKYFEINMDNLSLAVSTIPFYERNGVDQSLFSESDMLSMNDRATKYKQKYYNDKSYSTPETEAYDKILNKLKENECKKQVDNDKLETNTIEKNKEQTKKIREEDRSAVLDIDLDFESITILDDVPSPVHSFKETKDNEKECSKVSAKNDDDIVDLLLEDEPNIKPVIRQESSVKTVDQPIEKIESEDAKKSHESKGDLTTLNSESKAKDTPAETKKNPVIESPEDLEKWLDKFLDG